MNYADYYWHVTDDFEIRFSSLKQYNNITYFDSVKHN
jgi:hypothetical protein